VKTAMYIEDGVTQVVLTPTTDDEKAILALVEKAAESGALSVYRGSFYECRGGWVRAQLGTPHIANQYLASQVDDRSLMLVVRNPRAKESASE
jgi:hypothetical protein